MRISVASYGELVEWMEKGEIGDSWSLISVVSYRFPESVHSKFVEEVKRSFSYALFLFFDDVDEFTMDMGSRPITHEQARKILEFLEMIYGASEVLVCQCEAGISRSSAIASFALLWKELKELGDKEKAVSSWKGKLNTLSQRAGRTLYPNSFVFRQLSKLLDLEVEPPFSIP